MFLDSNQPACSIRLTQSHFERQRTVPPFLVGRVSQRSWDEFRRRMIHDAPWMGMEYACLLGFQIISFVIIVVLIIMVTWVLFFLFFISFALSACWLASYSRRSNQSWQLFLKEAESVLAPAVFLGIISLRHNGLRLSANTNGHHSKRAYWYLQFHLTGQTQPEAAAFDQKAVQKTEVVIAMPAEAPHDPPANLPEVEGIMVHVEDQPRKPPTAPPEDFDDMNPI